MSDVVRCPVCQTPRPSGGRGGICLCGRPWWDDTAPLAPPRGHEALFTPDAGLPAAGATWRGADSAVLMAVPVSDLALMLFADGMEAADARARLDELVSSARVPPP